MLERLFQPDQYITNSEPDQLPDGVIEITYINLLVDGSKVKFEARQTDRVGKEGLFTVFEHGTIPDGSTVSDTGEPTKYTRRVIGHAPFKNAKKALKTAANIARGLHDQNL